MKTLSLILLTVFLTACATPQQTALDRNYAEKAAAAGTTVKADPATAGPSTGQTIAGLLLLPVALPVLLLTTAATHRYGSGGYRGVHCKSYEYKDQFHTKCY